MYSQTTIVGRIGQDAILNYTPQGLAICKFSVAVSKVTGKGESRKEHTTWVNCTAWRERAENLSSYLKKGTLVMVIGEVSVSAYTNKEGKPAASLELNANEIKLLSSRSDTAASGDNDGNAVNEDGIDNIPF